MKSNLNKPKCGCGNTNDLNGYCDGDYDASSTNNVILLKGFTIFL